MHASTVQSRENWPLVLRESHWRSVLGLYWRVASPPSNIGHAMGEAFRWFDWIDWTEYDNKKDAEKKKYYDGNIAPLVGALERLHLLAEKATKLESRWRGKPSPDNRFYLAAREVAEVAKKRAEMLQLLEGGPHTPRARHKALSANVAATGSSPPHGGTEGHSSKPRSARHFREVMPDYKDCTEWPSILGQPIVKQHNFLLAGTEYWQIGRSLDEMFDTFLKINWYTYGNLIESRDLDGLRKHYKDQVAPLYHLLVRFVVIVTESRKHDQSPEHPITLYFNKIEDAAEKMRDLYYSMPGSTFTSKWEHLLEPPAPP